MSTRRTTLDPGAAARCAFRTVLEHDEVTRAARRSEPDATAGRRLEAAGAHRAHIADRLVEQLGTAAVDAGNDEAATLAAIAKDHVELVVRPRLPRDEVGRRHGSPSMLFADRSGADTAWRPVDVHNHYVTADGTLEFLCSTLDAPTLAEAVRQPNRRLRKGGAWRRDLLRLAHHHRMLEAIGAVPGRSAIAGVIDRSSVVWWLDLNDRLDERGSALVQHDARLAERVALLEATEARNLAVDRPRPGAPWWHRECEECPYSESCRAELEATDDVSLVRFTDAAVQEVLRDHGITTRRRLASLDLGDVARGAATQDEPSDAATPRAVAVGRRIKDADRLVRRARVEVAGTMLRLVEPSALDARRADVEIDFDMESYDNATYLWGTLVTTRVPTDGIEEGYRAFAQWGELTERSEGVLFAQFFAWLSRTVAAARAAGRSVRIYCFWEHAERGQMRRAMESGVEGLPASEAVEEVIDARLVDLHQVVTSQIQTAGPAGLKVVATAAGFAWRDGSPSGEASMAWYEEAVSDDEVTSALATRRLLEYNEDDCLATRALRDWLEGPARSLPDVEGARPDEP